MSVKKMEKEYKESFGQIPNDSLESLDYLLNSLNTKNINIDLLIKKATKRKWKEISYTIFLVPKATPRPRSGANGIFYVKGAKDNKDLFKKYFKNNDINLITTPTEFQCRSYLPIPKSMKRSEKILAELGFIYPTSKPDVDNLAKAYCDMIQGILLYDDSLVIKMITEKYYSVKPRIEIVIRYMDDYDSEFNKKKILKGRN